MVIISIASFLFRWASISRIVNNCINTIIESCPTSQNIQIPLLWGRFYDVVETITVCIINLWGYTEMLRKFLLFSISIQKVFRDHSCLFISYAFSSTLCFGAIEAFKERLLSIWNKKWKEVTLLLIVLIPTWLKTSPGDIISFPVRITGKPMFTLTLSQEYPTNIFRKIDYTMS